MAKVALAGGVLVQGKVLFGYVKFGPQSLSEAQFSIGSLPEQKVANTLLASVTNQQIYIGQACCIKVLSQMRLGELAGVYF